MYCAVNWIKLLQDTFCHSVQYAIGSVWQVFILSGQIWMVGLVWLWFVWFGLVWFGLVGVPVAKVSAAGPEGRTGQTSKRGPVRHLHTKTEIVIASSGTSTLKIEIDIVYLSGPPHHCMSGKRISTLKVEIVVASSGTSILKQRSSLHRPVPPYNKQRSSLHRPGPPYITDIGNRHCIVRHFPTKNRYIVIASFRDLHTETEHILYLLYIFI
jgi:hypothetical protein